MNNEFSVIKIEDVPHILKMHTNIIDEIIKKIIKYCLAIEKTMSFNLNDVYANNLYKEWNDLSKKYQEINVKIDLVVQEISFSIERYVNETLELESITSKKINEVSISLNNLSKEIDSIETITKE